MSQARLLLIDEDGFVKLLADYQGGYDPVSPAHKVTNQIIKFLEDQAVSKLELMPEDVIEYVSQEAPRIIHG